MPYTFYGQGKYLDDEAKAQRMILVGEDGEPPESGGDASAANQATEIAHLAAIEVAVEALAAGEAGDATAAHQVTQNAALAAIQASVAAGTALVAAVAVSVTTATMLLVAANATRDGVTFVNNSATLTLYLGNSAVSASTGIPLGPGQPAWTKSKAAFYGITASGTVDVRVLEEVA